MDLGQLLLKELAEEIKECIAKIQEETQQKLYYIAELEEADTSLVAFENIIREGYTLSDLSLVSDYLSLFYKQQYLIDKRDKKAGNLLLS